jgi:DNA-directed RNA polymerase subunit E'/Rpb7
MDPLFERRELTRNVHIQSKNLQKNMLQPLVTQLRMNLEGHCSSEGFIQSQSITILKYSIGRSNYTKGGIDYEVTFQADICFPHTGQVFKAVTDVRSKIGIHAMLPPLKILILRDLHIGNQEFENLESGKEIDHIVEVTHGGTNDINNLQVLCPCCHSVKTKRCAKQKWDFNSIEIDNGVGHTETDTKRKRSNSA